MPEIAPESLAERLARGKSVAAIVLLGEDAYLRDLCRSAIIEASVPEASRDWAVRRVSTREDGWDAILGSARTLPMLASRQVILAEDAESVEKLGDEARAEIVAALEAYLESPSPFTVLVLEARTLDKRQKFYKLLSQKALVAELAIGPESAAVLVAKMARDAGADIDREVAALLAEILNGEPARMHMEVEKLAAYALNGPAGGRITKADVEALVADARRNTVWQLADMLAGRQRAAALVFLDRLLRDGEQPAGIVGALAWRYRKLIEARDLPARTSGFQAARQLGMRPEEAEATLRNAHRIPRQELLAGLIALAAADSQLKSANPNPRATMEFLVARLTASPAIPV